ncbi:unnamed protein product [Sphagnum troendelagicum]
MVATAILHVWQVTSPDSRSQVVLGQSPNSWNWYNATLSYRDGLIPGSLPCSTAMTINHKDLVPGEVVVLLICGDICLLMSKDVFVWKKTPLAPSKRAVANTCQHEYADSLLPFLSAISCQLLLCSVASQPSPEEATCGISVAMGVKLEMLPMIVNAN